VNNNNNNKKKSTKMILLLRKNCRLNFLRQNYNYEYKEHEGKKQLRKDGRKLLLDALKLVGIGRRDRIPNYQGEFQL
jgi:hypothetical protein